MRGCCMECMAGGTGRGAGLVSGRFARTRSERIQSFPRRSSGCRSQRNEFEPVEPKECPSGGGEPVQSSAQRRRPHRGLPARSPIPELRPTGPCPQLRSEEHTSELQSHVNLVCRLLLEKKKKKM